MVVSLHGLSKDSSREHRRKEPRGMHQFLARKQSQTSLRFTLRTLIISPTIGQPSWNGGWSGSWRSWLNDTRLGGWVYKEAWRKDRPIDPWREDFLSAMGVQREESLTGARPPILNRHDWMEGTTHARNDQGWPNWEWDETIVHIVWSPDHPLQMHTSFLV